MTIEKRLTALEATCRLWQRMTWGLVLAFALALAAVVWTVDLPMAVSWYRNDSTMIPNEIRAKAFTLANDDGEEIGTFATRNGNVMLGMSLNGKPQAWIVTSKAGTELRMFNAKGNTMVHIEATRDQAGGHIRVYNNQQKVVATIGSSESDCGKISVHDFRGRVRDMLLAKP